MGERNLTDPEVLPPSIFTSTSFRSESLHSSSSESPMVPTQRSHFLLDTSRHVPTSISYPHAPHEPQHLSPKTFPSPLQFRSSPKLETCLSSLSLITKFLFILFVEQLISCLFVCLFVFEEQNLVGFSMSFHISSLELYLLSSV